MARPVTLAINGLGRIGRTVLRQIAARDDDAFHVVAVNDIADIGMVEYLLRFDSVFGPFPGRLERQGDDLSVNGRIIRVSRKSDLSEVDLNGVDVLMECTGKAKTRDWALNGLNAGAASVLISGPSATADVTVVLGANDDQLGDARVMTFDGFPAVFAGLDQERVFVERDGRVAVGTREPLATRSAVGFNDAGTRALFSQLLIPVPTPQ